VVKCADHPWQSARSGSDFFDHNSFFRADRNARFAAEAVSRIGYRGLAAVDFKDIGRANVYTFSALLAFTFVDFRQEHSTPRCQWICGQTQFLYGEGRGN
jgi:hypothetical protein